MIDYYEPQLDLTLMGCGFLGFYHVGAICLLRQIWPQKPFNRICGSSCGGLLGGLICAGVPLEDVLKQALTIINNLRCIFCSPLRFRSIRSLIEISLDKLMPEDAHERCSHVLGVSLTNLSSGENVLSSEFHSRPELLDALVAGCFIPLWSGSLSFPVFRSERFIDGAYSNNVPKFQMTDEDQKAGVKQVEVCPFAGDTHCGPPDRCGLFSAMFLGSRYFMSWSNIRRFFHAMFPHSKACYRPYLFAGHHDMKEFLFANKMIKCRSCYSSAKLSTSLARPTTTTPTTIVQTCTSEDSGTCISCLKLLERIDSLTITPSLSSLLE